MMTRGCVSRGGCASRCGGRRELFLGCDGPTRDELGRITSGSHDVGTSRIERRAGAAAPPALHRRRRIRCVNRHSGSRGGDHRALHAEARQRLRPLGCTALHLAGPIELRCCRFGCAILGLSRPVDLRPRRRPTLRRPARWRRHVAAPARRCSPEHAIRCMSSVSGGAVGRGRACVRRGARTSPVPLPR